MKTDGCDGDRAISRDTHFSGLAYFLPSLTDLTAAFIFFEEARLFTLGITTLNRSVFSATPKE
jgi:hypothetical protein